MATHSSVLACRIPGTEETGGLPSMGSHRVGHDWRDLAVSNIKVTFFQLFFFHFKTHILVLTRGEQDTAQEIQEDELNYKLL